MDSTTTPKSTSTRTIIVRWEDGDEVREAEVQLRIASLMWYERQAARHNLPTGEAGQITMTTYIAFRELKRAGHIPDSIEVEDWAETIVSIDLPESAAGPTE